MSFVTNWNDWEKLCHHGFYNEARVTPEEHPLVILEPPLNPKNNREKMTSIMFETFNVPALMVLHEAMASAVAANMPTGVVVDSGFTSVNATCCLNYYPLNYTSVKSNLGGMDVDEYLIKLLGQRGYEMTTSAERHIVTEIKEKHCYMSLDSEFEKDRMKPIEYELIDGSKMILENEQYDAAEVLFNPSLIGSHVLNFEEVTSSSINKSPMELKNTMFHNILLSGGNTMFKGLDNRLHFELENKHKREDIKVNAPDERKNLTWIGASLIGSLSPENIFSDLWITKDLYDDHGATIAHRMIL